MSDQSTPGTEQCDTISCNREATKTVAFGSEDDPFYREFCEPHAREETGKHDDARIVETDGGQPSAAKERYECQNCGEIVERSTDRDLFTGECPECFDGAWDPDSQLTTFVRVDDDPEVMTDGGEPQETGTDRKPCTECGRMTHLWRPGSDPPKCPICRSDDGREIRTDGGQPATGAERFLDIDRDDDPHLRELDGERIDAVEEVGPAYFVEVDGERVLVAEHEIEEREVRADGSGETEDRSERAQADPSNPKQCPNCGSDRTEADRQYLHTNPPESTLYRICVSCGAKYCCTFRAKPSLETVRVPVSAGKDAGSDGGGRDD